MKKKYYVLFNQDEISSNGDSSIVFRRINECDENGGERTHALKSMLKDEHAKYSECEPLPVIISKILIGFERIGLKPVSISTKPHVQTILLESEMPQKYVELDRFIKKKIVSKFTNTSCVKLLERTGDFTTPAQYSLIIDQSSVVNCEYMSFQSLYHMCGSYEKLLLLLEILKKSRSTLEKKYKKTAKQLEAEKSLFESSERKKTVKGEKAKKMPKDKKKHQKNANHSKKSK